MEGPYFSSTATMASIAACSERGPWLAVFACTPADAPLLVTAVCVSARLRLASEGEGEFGAGGSDGGVRVPLAAAMVMDSAVCDARAMGVGEVQRAHARRQGEVGQAPLQTAQHHTRPLQTTLRLHKGPWVADVRAARRMRAGAGSATAQECEVVVGDLLWSAKVRAEGLPRGYAKQSASVQVLHRRSPRVIVVPTTMHKVKRVTASECKSNFHGA